jgi:UTP--glucose-1-phosphate uridylyltransferase
MDVYEKYGDPVTALEAVPKKQVSNYGVAAGTKISDNVMEIDKFIEKPSIEKAPSNLIHIGREILTPEIIALLPKIKAGKDGEIRLADAFAAHIKKGKALYGCIFEGTRYDCGNKVGFLKAQIEFGLKNPETKKELRRYLKQFCKLHTR